MSVLVLPITKSSLMYRLYNSISDVKVFFFNVIQKYYSHLRCNHVSHRYSTSLHVNFIVEAEDIATEYDF
ncbi:hypothetical protein Y032_0378g308 [Ancylostoma ceylanicum]|uniref:Uncharacterized protein n=1 Tax=Ancylostoma ceylanicum TaxID=53326 RepID=A0A016RTI9_9BILA|nr:hypothetical protein Y032_0378g308 [Ancylostoma ceylanicum]